MDLKDMGALNERISVHISISGGFRWALSFLDSHEAIN